MTLDTARSKKDIIREAQGIIDRQQAMNARQIDSINRLLGHDPSKKDSHEERVYRYEHELMHVNEQLALADVRRGQMDDILRRVRQHAVDTDNANLLAIIGEVGVHEDKVAITGEAAEPATLGS